MNRLDEEMFPDLVIVPPVEIETSQEGPTTESENGIAKMLIDAISDSWQTIDKYNSIIATIESQGDSNISELIQEIANTELETIGKLQKALETVSPNVAITQQGEVAAENSLGESIYSDLYKPFKTPKKKKVKEDAILPDYNNPECIRRFNNSVDFSKLARTPDGANTVTSSDYTGSQSSGEGSSDSASSGEGMGESLKEEYNDFDKMGTPVDKLEDALGVTLNNTQINYIYDNWRAFYNNPDTYKDTVAVDLILHVMDLAGVLNSEDDEEIEVDNED